MDGQMLAQACGIDSILADILIERGIDSIEHANDFLSETKWIFHDPMTMRDMSKAVARIWDAVEKKEKILIVGDSDADGITATAVLYQYLGSIGADVRYYTPATDHIAAFWRGEFPEIIEDIGLIITVDCGVSALSEDNGCLTADVIVTDHHECKRALPQVYAVLDPKREGETYPYPHLSGAGVALKLICAMAAKKGDPTEELYRYCDLVAIGTVADAMPLTDENRSLVKLGLRQMQNKRRLGLEILLRSAGYNFNRAITASCAGFVIAPRLNAAGRVDRSDLAIELLCTDNAAKARQYVEKLMQFNRERQQIESVSVETAAAMVEQELDREAQRLLFLCVEDWPNGIAGIAASRLVDRYALPCVVVSVSNGIGRGSARSVKGFNMFAAVGECAELLEEFGGHELAAGFTVKEENIPALREAMKRQAEQAYSDVGYAPGLTVSAVLEVEQISLNLAHQLQKLEPYGMENPQPLFVTREVLLEELMPLANVRHLRLTLEKNGYQFTGLMFGHTLRELRCSAGDLVDIVYALDIHAGKQSEQLQLIIKKIEVSQCCLMEGYEKEYEQFMAGTLERLPEPAIPDRKDVIDVYSYLLRTMGEADADMPRYPTVMARRISRVFGKPFHYSQLMLSLGVLSELKMVELSPMGRQVRIQVNCCNEKKNLTQSALWKRLKG